MDINATLLNDIQETLATIESAIARLTALKEGLTRQVKPCRLAFVNFFKGGKSYAYTANETIAEGDIVMVPTASRGDIPGVVVYTENYTEDSVPFHNTKTVIGKLEDIALAPADLIRMTTELAPAVADKETAKSNLLAFLARRAATAASGTAAAANDTTADDNDIDWSDCLEEGDGSIPEPADGEPETTVTHADVTPF